MKLNDRLTELGYVFDEGLWMAETSEYKIYVTETEEGVQIAKMPDDPEESSLIIRFNRFDQSLFVLLEGWVSHA